MDAVLSRLGAVTSLETLSGQSLYELLQELPDRDPQGEVARGIYRTLIKSSVSVEESSHRDKFLRTGRMWGRRAGTEGYLPISELRYNANLTITKAIEAHISLVGIPMRMNTVLVKHLRHRVAVIGGDPVEAPSRRNGIRSRKRGCQSALAGRDAVHLRAPVG